jgi:hypothetical protein
MPRDEHGGVMRLRVEGLYRTMLERECQRDEMPDPRLFLITETPEWEQRKAQGRQLAALAMNERLAAGEPIRLARWQLSARTVPQVTGWAPYADRIHQSFNLSADDVLRPA